MNTETNETAYVKLKDGDGNEFVCPLNELRDTRSVSDDELESCFEGDVVGRYAGQLNIIEPKH